jgi:hypothetical protein
LCREWELIVACIDVNPNPEGYVYVEYVSEMWNWDNTNYRWMLLTSPFQPDGSSQIFVDDISANEFSDASYSRVTASGTGGPSGSTSLTWTADDVAFGALVGGETANYLVLFKQETNDTDSPLLVAYRIDRTSDGTAFTIAWNGAGTVLGFQQVFAGV